MLLLLTLPCPVTTLCYTHLLFHTLASSLKRLREKQGTSTRKLIAHSGPVYTTAFDIASPSPRYLLSCSADTTTRLWSLDTLTNVSVYRGHQAPVWDVQWAGVSGGWFATGSRDRTARLWSTERVAPLRVYAGHLSDVDVCNQSFLQPCLYVPAPHATAPASRVLTFHCSACVSILTDSISLLAPAIGLVDFGMYKRGHACESSLGTRVQ